MSSVFIGTWVTVSMMLVGPGELVHVHCEGHRCAAFVRSLVSMGMIEAGEIYAFPFNLSEKPDDRAIPPEVATGYLSEVRPDPDNPYGFSTIAAHSPERGQIEAMLFETRAAALAALGKMSRLQWQEVSPER